MVSNLYMSIRFLAIGEYAQMTLFFIYFILAIRGLQVWSRKNETKEIYTPNTSQITNIKNGGNKNEGLNDIQE